MTVVATAAYVRNEPQSLPQNLAECPFFEGGLLPGSVCLSRLALEVSIPVDAGLTVKLGSRR